MFHHVTLLIIGTALWTVFPVARSETNEWGTYFSLPSGHAEYDVTFHEIFDRYTGSSQAKTQCDPSEADFERWYVSSKNVNHYILSYYCRTKAVRGYEHLKVDITKKTVLDFQTSLKGYGIMNAGDYSEDLSETEGKELESSLLEAVKEDIAKEKRDGAGNEEYCPDPGTQTLFDISTKQENGLDYYKIAISCNVSQTPGYASHMTHIEVAVDNEAKALNGGKPVLAVLDYPSRNSAFIREKELETEQQKDGAQNLTPKLVFIVPVAFMACLKLKSEA